MRWPSHLASTDSQAPHPRPPETHPRSPRQALRWVVGALLLVGGVHLATLPSGFAWQTDAPAYLQHAENLRTGHPYTFTHAIPNPEAALAPDAYPPGYPAVLALGQALGLGLEQLKRLNLVFLLIALGAWAWLLRGRFAPKPLGAWVLVVGLSPTVWAELPLLIPHPLFLALVALALVALEEPTRPGEGLAGQRSGWLWGRAGLVALVIAAAVATRALGLALGLVVLVQALRWRSWASVSVRTLVLCAAGGLVLGASLLAFNPVLVEESYGPLVRSDLFRNLDDLHQLVFKSIGRYTAIASRLWLLPGGLWGGLVVFLATLPLVVLGFKRRWREGSAIEAFALCYFGSLLPWTFGKFRYFLPLVPLYFLYLAEGLKALPAVWTRRVGLALGGALALSYATAYARMLATPLPAASGEAELRATARYLAETLEPGATTAAAAARALAYLGDVPSLRLEQDFPAEGVPDSLFRAHDVRYVVWEAAPTGAPERAPCLELAYRNARFVVARVDLGKSCDLPGRPSPDERLDGSD